MHIIRFEDARGQVRFGREAGDGRAEVLEGELWAGLGATGKVVEVRRRLAPLAPVNVFCVGLNYRAHAAEANLPLPESPVLFMKPTTTVCGPGDPIRLPACATGPEVDYECELAVVIGTEAQDVPEERALEVMIRLYCRDRHGTARELCDGCRELRDYTRVRLGRCSFQEGKTTCARCPVHCYRPKMREAVREVMRYAGPRMLVRHPVLALRHLLDGRRREPLH